MIAAKTLRVHEHRFIGGPRANKSWLSTLRHSHAAGDVAHSHPDTGPASFALGKPKMTARSNGDQLPYIKTDHRDLEFTMVRGDLFASVCIGWCTNDSEGRWRWSVYRIVEGAPNKFIADGFDCAFEEAKAAAEASMASTPDLAVYRFAGLESLGVTP